MTDLIKLIEESEEKNDIEILNIYLENVDIDDFKSDVRNLVKIEQEENQQTEIDRKIDQLSQGL